MDRLDDPQVFLPDVMATHARFFPDKEAVICGNHRLTWGELERSINRMANRLGEVGIGRGDNVAVLMTNSTDMVGIMFGIVKAGACVVPLSGLLTADQVAGLVNDSRACAIVAGAGLKDIVVPVADKLETVRDDGRIAHGFAAEGWQDFEAWIDGAPETPPLVNYDMSDRFNIIYSSGTTGLPKGIVQTHRARQHWCYSNAIEMRFSGESRALTTTSLYSNGTWLMMLPILFTGGTLHVMESFEPRAFLQTVEREKITHTFMVPTQYIVTLAEPDFDEFDLSSLQTILSAGSSLRNDTKREVLDRMGKGLYELYGLSEGAATMVKPEWQERKFGSVGTPVVGFEIRIIDEEGNELPRGETGEIVGYGGGMMLEYWDKPEQTAEIIWRDERGRTFMRTGDVGRFDEDGFLYIMDRKKDMIISGGFNVFPTDIEAILGEHPDVMDVTVIGVPHDKWGETALALVIPAAGARTSEADLKDWANERLAKTQRLAAVEFREDFPRNALGKVLKRELREPYWS